MIIKNNTLFFYLFFCLFISQSYGQKNRISIADRKYEKSAYIDAITIYEKVVANGYKDERLLQRLANSYYFNAELTKAVKWYGELFTLNKDQDAEYYYRYAQTLKSVKDYDKANEMLEAFNNITDGDQRAKLYTENKNYLNRVEDNSQHIKITNASINSVFSDYGSAFFENKLIFSSARKTEDMSSKVFKWTNQSFTNLYSSVINPDGSLEEPVPFKEEITSKFHEATPIFTKDGKTMYFTRNNYIKGKRRSSKKNVVLLKLYKATLEEGSWKNVKELPFNSDNYSVAHPALSVDEKTLYFASDMLGTLGKSDLFKVDINLNGGYGKPKNLGKEINTEGRETFPFISTDNTLYFSSDGRPGLGGLDIYVSKIQGDTGFGKVKNLGIPINSSLDDFAYLIDDEAIQGFFTSNREGGKGYDDIYRFAICEQLLLGYITDYVTDSVLIGSKVSLFDSKFELLSETVSNEKGYYEFDITCEEKYTVRSEMLSYDTKEGEIIIPNTSGKSVLSLALKQPVKKGTDIAKILDLEIIYFDFDKWFIREDAAIELEKVLTFMQEYPNIKVDVRSHTDSRGTHRYNEFLSDKRAHSTRIWLIDKGISASRLTARGYGETQLVNHCKDCIKCTKEEHQANRRSEFIIVSVGTE